MLPELFRALILGVAEGITEWLPISSTGHMILINDLLGASEDSFTSSEIFLYLIQLGAILAVVTLFFKPLFPFYPGKTPSQKKQTWSLWFKIVVACVPGLVAGLVFNDLMDSIETPFLVAAMLILYGVLFIVVERTVNKDRKPTTEKLPALTYKTALLIGCFQMLAIVPGTSRSGATILGAILLGCSRVVATEFSFFLAIPVMAGMSFLKIVKNGIPADVGQIVILLVGMVVAYVVSLFCLRKALDYIKTHSFEFFGKYRIVLGVILVVYFGVKALLA